ncbi:MAG: hypothetical protein EZS28_003833 [Streblomastix strix]|uniref:Protein kinase domain-containing protein n=1 Tax=Streblomastix strix TaxID=222440 RepID=A0A5J4X1N3_9EUKA|nr:MAG: hypothetical protein EZS28_003833 [Streblomastix strix]
MYRFCPEYSHKNLLNQYKLLSVLTALIGAIYQAPELLDPDKYKDQIEAQNVEGIEKDKDKGDVDANLNEQQIKPIQGFASDIWAVGIVLYELLALTHPFIQILV